ncbi:MAG: gfo/Idh/MocA family oxidoreductase [Xanthobacteraceae bacterium]|nr:gfo/Idh/MocA family oxidoreductase [Xanthobacteraceae bacterium]
MSMRALVIGFGSIGARHAGVLEQLGVAATVVSRRGAAEGRPAYRTLTEALAAGPFDYAVVADETARHHETLAALAARGFAGRVLVEKPLFATPEPLPAHGFRSAGVGYNLRFHPAVIALREALAGREIQMADFHVGQWLGDWRPTRDVAKTYSASRAAGGGALRDLSHELDLATWLLGPWTTVAALGGRLGSVTVDADDGWGLLLSCERCPVVTIHMNCLDRVGRRSITVQADSETFHADLVSGTVTLGGTVRTVEAVRDDSYRTMHRAMIEETGDVCTLQQGLDVVDLIAAVERSAQERRFIERVSR